MERSTKMVLVMALFFVSFTLSIRGRELKRKQEKYEPQTFPGAGNFFGSPGGLGGGSGLVPGFGGLGQPALGGLGQPAFGSFPGFGTVPGMPGAGLGGGSVDTP